VLVRKIDMNKPRVNTAWFRAGRAWGRLRSNEWRQEQNL